MTERHEFIRWLRKRRACEDGVRFAKQWRTPQEAWENAGEYDGTDDRIGYRQWLVRMMRSSEDEIWQHKIPSVLMIERFPRIPWKRGMK